MSDKISDKIQPLHLSRKAILYVRQSSNFQVQHNEESQHLQYAVKKRLEQLGWQEIEVIDEDLGRSASGSTTRSGFERMVADELEKRWNNALKNVADIESRLAQLQSKATDQEEVSLAEFESLASDVERIWNAPDCDARIKNRIVRALIENVIADIDHDAFEVVLTIHWVGGVHTELRVPRRRRGKATATATEAIDAVKSLSRICSDDLIAGYLNRNGLRTGRGNRFTRERITSLRSYHNIECYSDEIRLQEGWLNLTEAAKFLGVSNRTLRLAIECGDVVGEHPLSDGPWIIHRENLQTPQAKAVARKAKQRTGNPAVPGPDQQKLDFYRK